MAADLQPSMLREIETAVSKARAANDWLCRQAEAGRIEGPEIKLRLQQNLTFMVHEVAAAIAGQIARELVGKALVDLMEGRK